MNRIARRAVPFALSAGLLLCTPGLAAAQEAETPPTSTAEETASAIRDAAPKVLDNAAEAKVDVDAPTAMSMEGSGGSVAAPSDPSAGLVLDPAGGPAVSVGLPGAKQADDAVQVTSGAIAYGNGASNNVVVADKTGATVLATLNDRSAPQRYAYPLDLALGQTVQATADGGFVVLQQDGQVAMSVSPAWAKDADGKAVPARYELDGSTITMVVDHTSEQYAYPIVADPRFSWAWHGTTMYLSRGETKFALNAGWIIGGVFVPGGKAVQILVGFAGYGAVEAASRMVDRGYCLAVYKPRWHSWAAPWVYRC